MMSYTETVLSRMMHPGFFLIVIGAIVGFGSGIAAQKLFLAASEKAGLAIKAVGCAVVLIGTLLLLK